MPHSSDDRHKDAGEMPHQDGGFLQDMSGGMGRRGALWVLGAGALALGGWALFRRAALGEADVLGLAADGTQCVKLPEETGGPYPADGTNVLDGQTINVLTESGVLRSDIRGSFAGLNGTAAGIPLALEITLVDVDLACAPIPDLALYLWHCDAAGGYSIYSVPGVNYLRGLQISNAAGVVRFTTILPGCYDGRWPHMHFEVFAGASASVSGKAALLTSQLALPEAVVGPLYAGDARYTSSVANLGGTSLTGDMVFGDNTALQIAQQTLTLTGDAAGLTGRLTVALRRT